MLPRVSRFQTVKGSEKERDRVAEMSRDRSWEMSRDKAREISREMVHVEHRMGANGLEKIILREGRGSSAEVLSLSLSQLFFSLPDLVLTLPAFCSSNSMIRLSFCYEMIVMHFSSVIRFSAGISRICDHRRHIAAFSESIISTVLPLYLDNYSFSFSSQLMFCENTSSS